MQLLYQPGIILFLLFLSFRLPSFPCVDSHSPSLQSHNKPRFRSQCYRLKVCLSRFDYQKSFIFNPEAIIEYRSDYVIKIYF